jgi:hypothetical protein
MCHCATAMPPGRWTALPRRQRPPYRYEATIPSMTFALDPALGYQFYVVWNFVGQMTGWQTGKTHFAANDTCIKVSRVDMLISRISSHGLPSCS